MVNKFGKSFISIGVLITFCCSIASSPVVYAGGLKLGTMGAIKDKVRRPMPPGGDEEAQQETTGSDGEVVFHDPVIDQEVTVKVEDASTAEPVSGMCVTYLNTGKTQVCFASDPSGKYFPAIKVNPVSEGTSYAPPQRVIPLLVVLAVVAVASAAYGCYDLSKDPPEVELIYDDEGIRKEYIVAYDINDIFDCISIIGAPTAVISAAATVTINHLKAAVAIAQTATPLLAKLGLKEAGIDFDKNSYRVAIPYTVVEGAKCYMSTIYLYERVLGNSSPDLPGNPYPAKGATDIPLDVTLSWVCSDPNGDLISYDVYFEANDSTPDVPVSNDQSETTYQPGDLSYDRHYYWKVIATDCHDASKSGPVWDFVTASGGGEDTYEPNNSFDTAHGPLTSGQQYESYIWSSSDVDYYKISTTEAGTIKVNLTSLPANYDLYLYDSSRTEVASSINSGTTIESINYSASSTGTYYIKVIGSGGANSDTNSYLLKYTFTSLGVGGWQIETVDSADVGDSSMALDTNNYPHISYLDYTDGLKYARWTGSSWNIEIVDSADDVGSFSCITLDTYNFPHISYCDFANGNLKYAKWTGSEWSIQTVDSTGFVGRFTSIALDTDNYPHICYEDDTNGTLKYAKWDGSFWQIETVGLAGYTDTCITLDTYNFPHISNFDGTNGTLKYTKWTGSEWQSQTVDSGDNVGCFSCICLDTSNYPHISYHDGTDQDLKYAKWTGFSWFIETVDSTGNVGHDTSIAVDTNNHPHISYGDFTNYDLKYARWTGSEWDIQTIDSGGKVGWTTSIVLDTNDYPHISYADFTNSDLKYAHWVPSEKPDLIVSNIDAPESAAKGTDIIISNAIKNQGSGPANGFYIYFYLSDDLAIDTGDRQIGQRYVSVLLCGVTSIHNTTCTLPSGVTGFYYVGAIVDPTESVSESNEDNNTGYDTGKICISNWQIQIVDSTDNVGWGSSIALDRNNHPHISYYDLTNYTLKYAKWTGLRWEIEIVDLDVHSAYDTSISLDINDRPHICYCPGWANEIKYAKWNGVSWDTQTIESGGEFECPSLTLDSNDHPHIAYHNFMNGTLKYTKWNGDSWQIEIVDSGDVGWWPSIVLDSYDCPHISHAKRYIDEENSDLKYAKWNGDSWQIETVDSGVGKSGMIMSRCDAIGMTSDNSPCIFYSDWANDHLKYAKWNGSFWEIQTVSYSGGLDVDMAVSANDWPHVSYTSYPDESLQYEKWTGSGWIIETVDSLGSELRDTSIALDENSRPHISYLDYTNGDLKYARPLP